LIVAWLALIVVFGLVEGGTFLNRATLSGIFGTQSVLVVVALGLLFPLTAGDYDLSVGGNISLSMMLVAILNVNLHLPVLAAVAVALSVGALVGVVNGAITVAFDINPFIVTLGTGTVLDGITYWISGSNTVSNVSSNLSKWTFTEQIGGISLEFYFCVVIAAVIWLVFNYLRGGRHLLYTGQNRNVAKLSGVRIGLARSYAFVACGILASVAGVLYVGTSGGASPGAGDSYLLPAYAAVFLGATTIVPGRFNPWGTLVAVYFLVTGITGLTLLGASSYVQDLFYGGALVFAVIFSRLSAGGGWPWGRGRYAGQGPSEAAQQGSQVHS
jgi:ribose transport system permease protein